MLDKANIPQHIAIIMDGNGRWASSRHLPKIMGHRKGAQAIREILSACGELGVGYLTLYAFSTENSKRPKKEVDGLMRLLEEQLTRETANLVKNNVRLNAIGRINSLPQRVQLKLRRAIEATKKDTGVVLTLALAYGGRSEIVDAVKNIIDDAAANKIAKDDVIEDTFSRYLYTADMPDPDLLIRTSSEMRVSNFLLWQISYTELYIARKLWPDFKKADLEKAIEEYQKRQRRYGG